jgi:hypothetical protein
VSYWKRVSINRLPAPEAVEDEFFDDSDERDELDYCACKYCNCLNRTAFGVCEDCASGGHQG